MDSAERRRFTKNDLLNKYGDSIDRSFKNIVEILQEGLFARDIQNIISLGYLFQLNVTESLSYDEYCKLILGKTKNRIMYWIIRNDKFVLSIMEDNGIIDYFFNKYKPSKGERDSTIHDCVFSLVGLLYGNAEFVNYKKQCLNKIKTHIKELIKGEIKLSFSEDITEKIQVITIEESKVNSKNVVEKIELTLIEKLKINTKDIVKELKAPLIKESRGNIQDIVNSFINKLLIIIKKLFNR